VSAPERHARRGERRRVLLVGADAALRTVASLHLTPRGLDLIEASDEAAALELAQLALSAVVARADRPRVDVTAFLERLRAAEDARVRDLPVVLVAATRSTELEALCARLPPARLLAAPVTGPRLVATIDALLER
jgi:CheY-like chemotaxis protein